MKTKKLTVRAASKLSNEELIKLHKDVHSQCTQAEKRRDNLEKQLWETHDLVVAELNRRPAINFFHKSPVGKEETTPAPYECTSCGESFAEGEVDPAGDCPACGGEIREVQRANLPTTPLVEKEEKTGKETYDCECLDCGHKMQTSEHCRDIKCEKCGGEMRRAERPGVGKDGSRLQKPYPNEHACRVSDPKQYDEIRRKNDEFGEGIDVLYGVKDDESEVQAIRFDKNKFTAQEAKDWAKEHDYKCTEFEAAEKSEKGADLTKIKILGKVFLMADLNEMLREFFSDIQDVWSWVVEIELDDSNQLNAIVDISTPEEYLTWKIPFSVEGGIITLHTKDAKEVEVHVETSYVEKRWNRVAKLVKGSEDDERRYALYMVYAPKELDSQGEWATAEEIEKMCWGFGLKCYFSTGERIDKDHDEQPWKYKQCAVVENAIVREEGYLGMKKGTWIVGIIHGEKEWEALKKGELGGVSIGGYADRRDRAIQEAGDDE